MDSESLEPLDIDDRTGGERMLASARAGVNRVGELVDEQRLDIVALIWVGCTVAYTGAQIYQVAHLFGQGIPGFDAWGKIAALGQTTAGPVVAISCVVGIALALMSDTTVYRFAILLAGILGAWVLVAGVFDAAAAAHQTGDASLQIQLGQGNRVVQIVGGLALAGFGLVVMMLAWRAGGTRPAEPPAIS